MRVKHLLGLIGIVLSAGSFGTAASAEVDEPWEARWTAPGPPIGSVLAVDEIGSVAVGYEGQVRAIDREGRPAWSADLPSADVGNAPIFAEGRVLVPTGDRIAAFDRSSGSLLWEQPARGARLAVGQTPEDSNAVLAASKGGRIHRVDATSGRLLELVDLSSRQATGAPHVWVSGALGAFAWASETSCCHVGAFDLSTGGILWERKLPRHSTVPVVHDDALIVGANARREAQGRIHAFDLATGRTRWSIEVSAVFGPGLHGDAEAGDVVIADRKGSMISLDVETGEVHWKSAPVEGSAEAHPQIAGDRVFLTPHSVGLVEVDRASGSVVQQGRFRPEVVVHYAVGLPGRFEVLVGSGFESAVWAFEQPSTRFEGAP